MADASVLARTERGGDRGYGRTVFGFDLFFVRNDGHGRGRGLASVARGFR